MKALFETADVSIRRGDQTRVISREEQAVVTKPVRRARPEAPIEFPPGLRPGPRVDVVLWLVLAVGLFGIASWMLAYGL